jgi:hypothetical protein
MVAGEWAGLDEEWLYSQIIHLLPKLCLPVSRKRDDPVDALGV